MQKPAPPHWPLRLATTNACVCLHPGRGRPGAGPKGIRPLPHSDLSSEPRYVGSRTSLRGSQRSLHRGVHLFPGSSFLQAASTVLPSMTVLGHCAVPGRGRWIFHSFLFSTLSGMGAQLLQERKQIPQRFSVWSIESCSDLRTVPFGGWGFCTTMEGFLQEAPKVGGIGNG